MEALCWAFRTRDSFALAWPLALGLTLAFVLVQSDFVGLLLKYFFRLAFFGRHDEFEHGTPGERPSGLVIIPSLLRNEDDFNAITITVESCATNDYPSELVIIASVDGRTEQPELYQRLVRWVSGRRYPLNVQVYVGGTETRLGKMMAVEAGVILMRHLVAAGRHASFPELYFSVDGDGTLGPQALERLAARITTPHPLSRNLRRVVSGKICIRPDLFWRGWTRLPAQYFSVPGQIYLQVAREFLLSNIARHNWKLVPQIGIPGALYCTWSNLLIQAPRYMAFMKTLRLLDWLGWWSGAGPPRFSTCTVEPCPEALTGASDDTCIAFLASMACWSRGGLSLDAPATPFHALGRLLRAYFIERSHDYEPEARVYTYTPSTLKGLWTQRVRWNSSRFECTGRFWRAFGFHWEIGFLTVSHLVLVMKHVVELSIYYLLLPYCLLGESANATMGYVLGYAGQTIAYSLFTLFALVLERERARFWPVVLCLPLSALYLVGINFFGCVYGVVCDVLLLGSSTNFAPEWTLKRGRTERIAILFRLRRFLVLSVRAVVFGDVPIGYFWLGWGETPWTPSGYEGWTTGRKAPSMLPEWSSLFTAKDASPGSASQEASRGGADGGAKPP